MYNRKFHEPVTSISEAIARLEKDLEISKNIMNKIDSFQTLLMEGAIFDVPESGPWVLFDQQDNEICRGGSLREMIENSPAENSLQFSELDSGQKFVYLEENYLKLGDGRGMRLSDGFNWRFKGDEQIFSK